MLFGRATCQETDSPQSAPTLGAPPTAAGGLGLSSTEADQRLRRNGPNLLPSADRRRWPRLLAEVLRQSMLLLLIAATILYLALGEAGDVALLAVSGATVIALTLSRVGDQNALYRLYANLSAPSAKWFATGEWYRPYRPNSWSATIFASPRVIAFPQTLTHASVNPDRNPLG